MPCKFSYGPICKTYKTQIGSGAATYHGELCGGCMFWEDSPEDRAFKERIGFIVRRARQTAITRMRRR